MAKTSQQSSNVAEVTPTKVHDFEVLAVHFPLQKAYPHSATHYLFLRPDAPNRSEGPNLDTPRTLFIANVPIDATESKLRQFFKYFCGARVESVAFEADAKRAGLVALNGEVIVQGTSVNVPVEVQKGKKRKRGAENVDEKIRKALEEMELPRTWERELWPSGSSAAVVFVDQATRDLVLKECRKAAKKGSGVDWNLEEEELGEKRYREHHDLTYPPAGLLQGRVNAYLTHFTKLEAARATLLSRQRNVPDEDGFTTVTRGGRSGPARLEDAQAAAERLKDREKKRIGGDFYRYQTREGRKLKERELKDKYEEDRKRIQTMRERRGKIRPE